MIPFLTPVHPASAPPGCDVTLVPGFSGIVDFSVFSDSLPLARVEGVFTASPGLRIDWIDGVGAAIGMAQRWQPNPDGSMTFVMWADQGAPLPAKQDVPCVRVHVHADRGTPPSSAILSGVVTAASDANGAALPLCAIATFQIVAARVCFAEPAPCDANGDGVTNVADLVRIVNCWFEGANCPSPAAQPDCTRDGEFGVEDVICCARSMLEGVPPDTLAPRAKRLRIAFGTPTWWEGLLQVPLEFHGAAEMNGAMLRVRYPTDRLTSTLPVFIGTSPLAHGRRAAASGASWFPYVEPGPDDVLVAELRLDVGPSDDVTEYLWFKRVPGQEPAGEVRVVGASIVAPDGSDLSIDLDGVAFPVPPLPPSPPLTIALSPARPNPAAGATEFIVSLSVAADVDLGVFDVAGRRVATLQRGLLGAGASLFQWRPEGRQSGVFFARLAVNGMVRTSRVAIQAAR